MSVDYKKLRELAEAATPGPWTVDCDESDLRDGEPRVAGVYGPEQMIDYGMGPERVRTRIIETDSGVYEPKWNDAAFIAAADPTTIIDRTTTEKP